MYVIRHFKTVWETNCLVETKLEHQTLNTAWKYEWLCSVVYMVAHLGETDTRAIQTISSSEFSKGWADKIVSFCLKKWRKITLA